jgi:RNA polymerase sigma-54 factor
MVLLQNKLNLKVSQKQILTPGLVQMVSVLALNKLELKDMITAEMVENPVLDELEVQVPTIEEISQREEKRDRVEASDEPAAPTDEKKDPFDEIDFGSFFRDYLDPGHRTHYDLESLERPSFENFLSKPSTLTDHLLWQLGSLSLSHGVREAAEEIIGNLNEDGYLTASEDELLGIAAPAAPAEPAPEPEPAAMELQDELGVESVTESALKEAAPENNKLHLVTEAERKSPPPYRPNFTREHLREALPVVQSLDPIGVAARDLQECLLLQLRYHQAQYAKTANGNGHGEVLADALAIVEHHLKALQNKQYKEIARAIGRSVENVNAAFELIKTLDPKPGLRYNLQETRLIEPDAAFVKQGDEWFVVMNEDDLPQLRLNPTYKKLMVKDAAEKDVRNYVKERYKSALQLIKNIEQRKQTILKVCYSIIARQRDFLELGIDQLKPMMIKEVAEEIGVHPSTVSRAVANKYVHTPQGVFELRYFFSESVNGPEGGGTSLLILKRRVKKLIEEEDPAKPLTDEQITRILQSQGIQVTRRTVAKYREDMKIPSTHQRRVKD